MSQNEWVEDDNKLYRAIDHIAIAVRNLEDAVELFCGILRFNLVKKRTTTGSKSGMVSAEIERDGIKFVLCEGLGAESQVTKLIDAYGPGVAHIALSVENVQSARRDLGQRGLKFDTTVISSAGLEQVFSERDKNSGISFEFISRKGEEGFNDDGVSELFRQLEERDSY